MDKPIVLIGRHQECDIQIPSRKVSRRHCCLAQVNGHVVVRDLCSTNGIRVNGIRIQEGNIKPGDELTIGSHKYYLAWPSQNVAPVQMPAAVGRPQLPHLVPLEEREGLESCEEPVALPEPQPMPAKNPFLPAAVMPTYQPKPKRDPLPPPEMPSLGIPEDMALQPMVDSKIVPPIKLN
ncbi:MAG: FHA domain-containing protein [Planctomycetes bacterium]|nr:FHA domain-containing protein [Planctomycetota bacterium]